MPPRPGPRPHHAAWQATPPPAHGNPHSNPAAKRGADLAVVCRCRIKAHAAVARVGCPARPHGSVWSACLSAHLGVRARLLPRPLARPDYLFANPGQRILWTKDLLHTRFCLQYCNGIRGGSVVPTSWERVTEDRRRIEKLECLAPKHPTPTVRCGPFISNQASSRRSAAAAGSVRLDTMLLWGVPKDAR